MRLDICNETITWSCLNQYPRVFETFMHDVMLDLTGCNGFEFLINNGVYTLDEPYLIEKEFMESWVNVAKDVPDTFYLHKLCLNVSNKLVYGKCTYDDKVFYIKYEVNIPNEDVASDDHMY